MNEIEFNKSIRALNEEYYSIFKAIPCIRDFSCTRDEYVNAMKKSIEEKTQIEKLLRKAIMPKGKDVII